MELADILVRIDQSALSHQEQAEFSTWLGERSDLQITLGNALRRDKLIQASLSKRSVRREAEFAVRILDQ